MARSIRAVALVSAGLLALTLGACSSNDSPEDPTTTDPDTSQSTDEETDDGDSGDENSAERFNLETVTEGKLTIAAAEPGYPPYVIDDDPTNGEGFETAVAYAVAAELGYDVDDVEWVRANWDLAIAPGAKPYDFTLQQVGIREDRAEFLDFSSPYYKANQAVVTLETTDFKDAASIADLKDARIGAASGTSSLEVVEDVIQPNNDALVFNNNDDLKLALVNNQIDALVVDLPTALFLADVELDGGVLVGQLEGTSEDHTGWGLVLVKDSPITAAVSGAVDALRENGTLDELVDEWLTSQGAPLLEH